MDETTWTHWEQSYLLYLEKEGRGKNTLKNYRLDLSLLRRFLEDTGKLPPVVFDLQLAQNYERFLAQRSQRSNSNRRRMQTARLFLDFLVAQKIYKDNPFKKASSAPKWLDIPHPTPPEDILRLWTGLLDRTRQQQDLSQTLAYRDLMLFSLIFCGGLKISELTSLLAEDVIFQDEDTLRLKVSRPRRETITLPLPPFLIPLVSEYLRQLKNLDTLYPGFSHRGLFFNANQYRPLGNELSMRGVELIFQTWEEHYHVKVVPKNLRQSCIIRWIHHETKDSLIKEWLGLSQYYSLADYKRAAEKSVPMDLSLLSGPLGQYYAQ